MSFRKLAAPLLVALALVPLAHAQVADDITLTVGAIHGTVTEDKQDVIPYKGNVTVDVTIKVGCVAILNAMAMGQNPQLDHVDVAIADPPAWIQADSHDVEMDPSGCAGAAAAGGYLTLTGSYPFSVAAEAPGITTQSVNLTASLEGGAESDPMPLLFSVQYHPDYTVVPSIQFPATVSGNSLNFTVTVTNKGNARGMVMMEELHASTGALSGLTSVAYQPPETKTFQAQFKAPDTCWSSAKVDFKTFAHYLLLDQRAGSYKDARSYDWEFTNGIACTPGKGNTSSKSSPVGGLVTIPALLGVALLVRRFREFQ
jgi:hypothetical protein